MTDETLGDLIATLGSVDDDEIDWPNVRQTTVLVQQSFAYEYPGPIEGLRHRLMVVPPDYHDDQRLLYAASSASPAATSTPSARTTRSGTSCSTSASTTWSAR